MKGSTQPFRTNALVYLVCAACCIVWSWWVGKDLSWDLLNYHLYSGRSAWLDRWGQDFLPASIQSYLSPYAYVPFAAMLSWGWPDIAVGSFMAALHAVNLFIIWLIAARLFPGNCPFTFLLRSASVVLAGLTPIFLQELGTSFADVSTAIPCLVGYLFLLDGRGPAAKRGRTLVLAGLFFGMAGALKLTNVLYGVGALLAVLLFWPGHISERMRATTLCAIGCVSGFVAVYGVWAYRLAKEFGNPFFPFFNAVFRSADFPERSIQHYRFVHDSLWSALGYPFSMTLPDREIYTETSAPDLKFAVVAALLGIWALRVAVRRLRLRRSKRHDEPNLPASPLVGAFCIGYLLWLYQTSNGRYALPLLLLAGPLAVWLLTRCTTNRRILGYGVLGAVLAQAIASALGTDHRWNPQPWSGEWVNVHVPPALKTTPTLFVSLDVQSMAFLSAYVDGKSGFVNAVGQYDLEPGLPGFTRLQVLNRRYGRDIRVLIRVRSLSREGWPMVSLDRYRMPMKRLGYAVDEQDCSVITLSETSGEATQLAEPAAQLWSQNPDLIRQRPEVVGGAYVLACRVNAMPAPTPRISERVPADDALDRIEDACPRLFSPHRPPSEIVTNGLVLRRYVESDVVLWASGDEFYYRTWRTGAPVRLGSLAQWSAANPPAIACKARTAGGAPVPEMERIMDAFMGSGLQSMPREAR